MARAVGPALGVEDSVRDECAADSVVRKVAAMAALGALGHVLRHTCLTGLVRRGTDLVTVAELAGHSRVETRGAPRARRPRTASMLSIDHEPDEPPENRTSADTP